MVFGFGCSFVYIHAGYLALRKIPIAYFLTMPYSHLQHSLQVARQFDISSNSVILRQLLLMLVV